MSELFSTLISIQSVIPDLFPNLSDKDKAVGKQVVLLRNMSLAVLHAQQSILHAYKTILHRYLNILPISLLILHSKKSILHTYLRPCVADSVLLIKWCLSY